MAGTEQTKIEVLLDGRQASDQLKELSRSAAELRISLAKAYEANDAGKVAEAEWELSKLDTRMKQLRKETVDVTKVLANLSGATMTDLKQSISAVDAKLNGKNIRKNSEEWNTLVDAKRRLIAQYSKLRSEISGTDSVLQKSSGILNEHNVLLAGAATAVYKMIGGLRSCASAFNNYEEAFQEVSALTGLTGESLEFMKTKAVETGGAMLEGGIRVSQGATDILNAYKMIGSQRPELLKDGEALHGVTVEAIILSEAAKMDLQPAAEALTNSLNQFDASADNSRRFINALAAGSQAGAGDIRYLSQAIEKSGTTANLMGVQFEELVAIIETAAPKFNEAAVAGNSIDKVLMEMKAKQIGFRNGVFDMNTALEELAGRFAAGELASDVFGKEHAKMVEVLVNGRDEFTRYHDAVSGTNKAVEQAAVNTDTNKAKMGQLKAQMESLRIEVGEKLTPIMGGFTQASIYGLKVLSPLVGVVGKYYATSCLLATALTGLALKSKILSGIELIRANIGKESLLQGRLKILALNTEIAAISGRTLFTKGATAAEISHIQAIRAKIAATKASNAALAQTPWGLIAVGAAAAIGFIVDLVKNTNKLSQSQQRLNDIEKQHSDRLRDQAGQMAALYAQIKKTNSGTQERINLVDRLDELLPGVIDKQELYRSGLEGLELSEKSYRAELEKWIRLQANEAKYSDLVSQQMEAEEKLATAKKRLDKAQKDADGALGTSTSPEYIDGVNAALERAKENVGKMEEEIGRINQMKSKINFSPAEPEVSQPATHTLQASGIVFDQKEWEAETEKEISLEIEKSEKLNTERSKRIESERKYREEILAAAKSALEQEDILNAERLAKAGLAGAEEDELRAREARQRESGNTREADSLKDRLAVLEALQKTHRANILKITSDTEKAGTEKEKQKFAKLAANRNKELQARQAGYSRELALLRIRNNEELAAESITAEQRKNLKEKHLASEKELSIRQTEEMIGLMRDMLREADLSGIDLSGKIFTPEEKEKFEAEILKLRETLSKMQADAAETPETPESQDSRETDVDVLGMTPDDWDTFMANLKDGKFGIEDMQNAIGAAMQVWGTFNNLMEASEKRQLKQYEQNTKKKRAALDRQLEAGEISQEQYNARVSQMDAELDAKKAELENKQAKRQKAMAIVEAITNTAIGITASLKAGGIIGPILAAIIGAMGAAQIATIVAQPLPGAEKGGYVDVVRSQDGKRFTAKDDPGHRGYVDRPTVITGESGREFIANDAAVANPSVRPLLDVIDAAQRDGSISRLDLTRYLPRHIEGRATGGSLTGTPPPSAPASTPSADPELKELLRKNTEVMQALLNKKVEIPWYGRGGIDEKRKKAEKYEQQTTIRR